MRAVRYERYGSPDVLAGRRDRRAGPPRPATSRSRCSPRASIRSTGRSAPATCASSRCSRRRREPSASSLAGEIVAVGGGPGPRHIGERVFGSLSAVRPRRQLRRVRRHRARIASCRSPTASSYEHAPPRRRSPPAPPSQALCRRRQARRRPTRADQRRRRRRRAFRRAGGQASSRARRRDLQRGERRVRSHRSAPTRSSTTQRGRRRPTRSEKFDVVLRRWPMRSDGSAPLRCSKRGGLLPLHRRQHGDGGRHRGRRAVRAAAQRNARADVPAERRRTQLSGASPSSSRSGVLKPHIAHSVSLDEVADAQRRMEIGHGRGKTVVLPHGPVSSDRTP